VLKQITDRHEVLHGLSAIAELLVTRVSLTLELDLRFARYY